MVEIITPSDVPEYAGKRDSERQKDGTVYLKLNLKLLLPSCFVK